MVYIVILLHRSGTFEILSITATERAALIITLQVEDPLAGYMPVIFGERFPEDISDATFPNRRKPAMNGHCHDGND